MIAGYFLSVRIDDTIWREWRWISSDGFDFGRETMGFSCLGG